MPRHTTAWWPRLLASALLAGALATPALAQAPEPARLGINSFPGAGNLPIWVAQDQGFFRKQGIDVTLSHPHGSVEQFKGLLDGRYPIITTAFDNIVAYHEGQGAPAIGTIPDLVAVMGLDHGLLTLVAAPGIKDVRDLKGHTLAVDALSTGFSFALKGILEQEGVNPASVSYIAIGSSESREKALVDGKAAAALLTLPADLDAADHGFRALTTVSKVFGPYLANVVATRQGWARAHRQQVTAFLRGLQDGIAWLTQPAHKDDTIAILHREMPRLDAGKLDRVYAELIDPKDGLFRDPAPDPAAARTVLALRAKYAEPPHKLAEVGTYVDTSFLSAP